MSSSYVFPVRALRSANSVSLVIFITKSPHEDDLIDAIREYCERNSPPDDVLLVGPSYTETALSEIKQSPRFLARVPGASRYINSPPVEIRCFDEKGMSSSGQSSFAKIIHAGLSHLFREYNGLIGGSSAFHYVKPSGRHCSAFLRTANVLVRGIEIEFIAACCLSACPPEMTRVYTDTGAIHSIAFALLRLLANFGDKRQLSTIDSFGSYTHIKDFPFLDQDRSLILISASTSGNLIDDVLQYAPQLRHNHILTLYFLGSRTSIIGGTLCDLTFHATDNPDGFDPIESYPAESCPLCVSSSPIRMSEEQFIPQGPQVQSVLVVAKDAAEGTSSFFQRLYGRGLIRANYREPHSSAASQEIYLDLLPLFSTNLFTEVEGFLPAFERLASHVVSANTKRIVHLNDKASQHFAGRIATFANECNILVDIVSAKALQETAQSHPQVGGTTIVVASAMSTGRSLSEVSKSLRFAQRGGAIKYVIGFSRPKDAELSRSVQRDLRYGENDSSEHHVTILNEFYLPSWRPEGKTSWQLEYDLLSASTEPLSIEWENRREALRTASSVSVRGLIHDLFLPTPSRTPLALRPSFAFWKFRYSTDPSSGERVPSQADVYATIASVLHNLRNPKKGAERSLGQSDLVRRIISPRCFERFNDGVIQAAILRAAHAAEIDYSIDDVLSEDMRSIIASILDQRLTNIGEASYEFLLALAMGRLRICQTHLASLYSDFSTSTSDPIDTFLWKTIGNKFQVD